jgi:hypothetical protein
MIMSSIKKRLPRLFDLLDLANFVSTIAYNLLILSWNVLLTRSSALDISAKPLNIIKILLTDSRTDHNASLIEKALVSQNHQKNLSTTSSNIQRTRPLCCFFVFESNLLYPNLSSLKTHNRTYSYNIIPRRA